MSARKKKVWISLIIFYLSVWNKELLNIIISLPRGIVCLLFLELSKNISLVERKQSTIINQINSSVQNFLKITQTKTDNKSQKEQRQKRYYNNNNNEDNSPNVNINFMSINYWRLNSTLKLLQTFTLERNLQI